MNDDDNKGETMLMVVGWIILLGWLLYSILNELTR